MEALSSPDFFRDEISVTIQQRTQVGGYHLRSREGRGALSTNDRHLPQFNLRFGGNYRTYAMSNVSSRSHAVGRLEMKRSIPCDSMSTIVVISR